MVSCVLWTDNGGDAWELDVLPAHFALFGGQQQTMAIGSTASATTPATQVRTIAPPSNGGSNAPSLPNVPAIGPASDAVNGAVRTIPCTPTSAAAPSAPNPSVPTSNVAGAAGPAAPNDGKKIADAVKGAVGDPTDMGAGTARASGNKRRRGGKSHKGRRDRTILKLQKKVTKLQKSLAREPSKTERDDIRASLASLKKQLTKQKSADWLTNIAYRMGAPLEIVKALDESRIKIVPDSAMDSGAAFDEESGMVLMRESTFKKLRSDLRELAKDGIVDLKKRDVKNTGGLRGRAAYHDIVVTQALVGAHEASHASDAHGGHSRSAARKFQSDIIRYSSALKQAGSLTGDAAVEAKKRAEMTLLKRYIAHFEYKAYYDQERYQWKMGRAPKKSGWSTIDDNGKRIDRDKALGNLAAFLSDKGFTAEKALAAASSADGHGHDHDHDIPGWRKNGEALPGWRKNGEALSGWRKNGEALSGWRKNGEHLPGWRKN